MHRVERSRHGARSLRRFVVPLFVVPLLVAVWAGAGITVGVLPAHADGWQHCSAVKGSLVISPGLSDVPTDQAVSLFARMTGCSREGGSGLLGATTSATQATCANLTAALLPTNATFAWTNGRTSTIALAFSTVPGSPNRLVLEGRVISGAGAGDRVDGGMHVSTKFTRLLQHVAQDHTRVNNGRRETVGPLTDGAGGDCTAANPIGTIKVVSFESLKFSTTQPPSTTTTTTTAPTTSSSTVSSTTTTAPGANISATQREGSRPAARTHARKPVIRRLGAVGTTTSSGSSIDPESVLGVICLVAAAVLLVLLLVPSRRMRRRRAAARALR